MQTSSASTAVSTTGAPAQLFSGAVAHVPFAGIPSQEELVAKYATGGSPNCMRPVAVRGAMQRVLRSLEELGLDIKTTAEMPDAVPDFEDFWEDAIRADAALLAAKAQGLPIEAHHAAAWSPEELLRRLGPVSTLEHGHHAADALVDHPLLLEQGGRWMAFAAFRTEEDVPEGTDPRSLPDDLTSLILSRAALGVERVVVKSTGSKAGIVTIDLHPGIAARTVEQVLYSEPRMPWDEPGTPSGFGMSMERWAGRPGMFLVQDWIPLEHEYRIFVVDGQAVTGAGCIEEHTPFDRIALGLQDPFSMLTRRVRRHPIVAQERAASPVEHGFRVVRQHLSAFQERFAPLLAGATVVVDVAIDARTGGTVVIELNSLPNSGLYASDPWLLHERLVGAEDRGYRFGDR